MIKNQRVFAGWYTGNIANGFGKILGFKEDEWRYIYEKNIELKIEKGKILILTITKTE